MGHQGHKGTAHRAPADIQPLPEMDHLLLESLGVGMRSISVHRDGALPERVRACLGRLAGWAPPGEAGENCGAELGPILTSSDNPTAH